MCTARPEQNAIKAAPLGLAPGRISMKIDADRVVSVSAMVIGLSSLFVFAYQARLMRRSDRESVIQS
jgi:hypothetical protein